MGTLPLRPSLSSPLDRLMFRRPITLVGVGSKTSVFVFFPSRPRISGAIWHSHRSILYFSYKMHLPAAASRLHSPLASLGWAPSLTSPFV